MGHKKAKDIEKESDFEGRKIRYIPLWKFLLNAGEDAMFTTSRYASLGTRRLAEHLALASRSAYCARSKKSIAQLVFLARREGSPRLIVLEERDGTPRELAFIQIDELGRWSWLARIGVASDA